MTNERLMIFHFFTVHVHLRLQGIWRHWWGFLCTLFFDPNHHVLDSIRLGFHAAARKNEFELLHVYRRRPWQRLLPVQKGPHCNSSISQASWLDKWSIHYPVYLFALVLAVPNQCYFTSHHSTDIRWLFCQNQLS